jgi:MinD-like ATPase involved in chromosome partitioning or flagellar assembly
MTPALGASNDFKVEVLTTQNRGMTPEEVAKLCSDKLIFVAANAPPAIADQARAFKANIEKLITHYMRQAIASDRTTVYNAIRDAGHPELAELIRRL